MANATHAGADVPPSSSYEERSEHRGSSPVALIVVCIVLAIVCIVLAVKLHSEAAVASQTRSQLTQSTAAQAQSQADLDKARTQETELQNRITAFQSSQADLQSQVNKSKADAADLQGRLTAVQSKQADLQSQLDKAKAQSADLQSQLEKAQASAAQAQPAAAQSHMMPVSASFEKSFWDHWYTLRMRNTGNDALNLQVAIADAGKTRTQNVAIQPGATENVHRLHSGDSVTVTGDGFDTLNLTAQ